jgi:hypothetical protein
LQHAHHDQINELINVVHVHNKVVAVRKQLVHIVHNLVADNALVVLADQADLVRAPVQVVHLEKVAERKRVIRVRKRFVKRSTIWRRPQLVAQLFRAVMEILQCGYDAALHLQILQRRLAQIPQR